jgi:hypothetical protein
VSSTVLLLTKSIAGTANPIVSLQLAWHLDNIWGVAATTTAIGCQVHVHVCQMWSKLQKQVMIRASCFAHMSMAPQTGDALRNIQSRIRGAAPSKHLPGSTARRANWQLTLSTFTRGLSSAATAGAAVASLLLSMTMKTTCLSSLRTGRPSSTDCG